MLCALPALAEEIADEDYVNHYFGTTLVFTSPGQYVDPAVAWWGDSLPEMLRYDNGYLAGMINAWRMQNNITPLLEPTGYNIAAGYEMQVEGGYEYNIDFIGIRPSEVELVLQSFGGAEAVMPGTTISWRPLRQRSYSAYSSQPGESLVLDFGPSSVTISPSSNLGSIQKQIEQLLREYYGPTVVFDLYYSQYSNRDGTAGSDISVYVEIPDPNAPMMSYEEEPVG
jgi:hypothetical protein